jgi:hypothetical protein
MIRKLFVGASLACALALAGAFHATPTNAQSQDQQQQQPATKSISGKVTAIGNGGHSFSLEVTGGNKSTMEFQVDKNTQVNGQVREGSAVMVEYQAMEGGKNLAVTITAQA